jgi:hypothetical protein
MTRHNGSVFNNGGFLDPANSKYTGIGWIDDGRKFLNSKHAKVGYGKGISLPSPLAVTVYFLPC